MFLGKTARLRIDRTKMQAIGVALAKAEKVPFLFSISIRKLHAFMKHVKV